MPSERFYKLTGDKQDRILEASMEEFIREGYQEASINQIIKDADISRGSFYTYFIDKEDLFDFIFGILKKNAYNSVRTAVRKNRGNIFEACRSLMNDAMKLSGKASTRSIRLFDKLFKDFGIMKHIEGKGRPDFTELEKLIDEIYENMDDLKERISRKEMDYLCDALITLSVKALITAKNDETMAKTAIETLFYQYDMIEKGIRGGK